MPSVNGSENRSNWDIGGNLCLVAAFLLPIGSRTSSMLGLDIAKSYASVVILLFLCWICGNRKARAYVPWQLELYLIYYVLHSLVCYYMTGSFGDELIAYRPSESDPEKGYLAYSRGIILFLIAFPLSAFLKSKKSLKHFVYLYSLGMSISIFLSFSDPKVGYSFSGVELRLAGGYNDPNALGTIGAIGTFLALAVHTPTRDFPKRFTWQLVLLINLSACIISGSRGALLGLMGGGAYFLLRLPMKRKFSYLLLAAVGVMMSFLILPDKLTQALVNRYSVERVVEDRGSRRIDIWYDYMENIRLEHCIGLGFRQAASIVAAVQDNPRPPHNQYLIMLVEQGVIGFALFLSGLYALYRRNRSRGVFSFHHVAMRSLVICWLIIMVSLDIGSFRILGASLGILSCRLRDEEPSA